MPWHGSLDVHKLKILYYWMFLKNLDFLEKKNHLRLKIEILNSWGVWGI
jgi:hypothetical protein